jgi:hypothetical protein
MVRRRRRGLDVVQLTRILEDDQAHHDLRLYYGVGLATGELPPFAGGRFEFLDGGGDRSDICNRFTSSDIFSLELLSVQLPPRQYGVGWVTAGKLLARKRPSLIPVYDDVVRCAFGQPLDIWKALHEALRQDDGSFRTTLEDLMKRAGIPLKVTPLRALDVALWMRHRSHHTGQRCAGLT